MSSCCHDNARLIFAMGLAAIVYGAVFGFLPRNASIVKTMVECVAKTPKNFISCVKGNGTGGGGSGSGSGAQSATAINSFFIVMATFGTVFLVLAIVFIFLTCCCCRGSTCFPLVTNSMLGLALPALLDGFCYLGSVLLLTISSVSSNTTASNALNIAGSYSGYVGVALAAGWAITILIGPVMTRNGSTCMKLICMVIGMAAAGGVYCAVTLVDPKKIPNVTIGTGGGGSGGGGGGGGGSSNLSTVQQRLYPALIVMAFIVADYVAMFFLCTCVTSGTCCCGKSE